nr:PilZ domain-containing protein [Propylenella binzhouense]
MPSVNPSGSGSPRTVRARALVAAGGFDVNGREDANGREEERHRTLKAGRIVLSDRLVLDCLIRDMSGHGARLKFGAFTQLPSAFEIFIPGERRIVPAELAWQNGLEAGVRFTGEGRPQTRDL